MSRRIRFVIPRQTVHAVRSWVRSRFLLLSVLLLLPVTKAFIASLVACMRPPKQVCKR